MVCTSATNVSLGPVIALTTEVLLSQRTVWEGMSLVSLLRVPTPTEAPLRELLRVVVLLKQTDEKTDSASSSTDTSPPSLAETELA